MSNNDMIVTALIDRFLSGDLTKEELIDFEQRLATDETLREELALQKGLTAVLEENARAELRDKVTMIHQNGSSDTSRVWIRVAAAAAVILLLAIPTYLLMRNSTPNGVQLAQTYFTPYPDRITQMSDSLTDSEKALSFYNTQNYPEAIRQLEALKSDSNALISLYLSISYLENDQTADALTSLKTTLELAEKSNASLVPTVYWYRIIAHLKANRLEIAKAELTEYLKRTDVYNEVDAHQLMEELN